MYYDPKWRSRYFRIIEKITFHIIAETITHFYRMRHRIIPYFHSRCAIDDLRLCRSEYTIGTYDLKTFHILIFRSQSFLSIFKVYFYGISLDTIGLVDWTGILEPFSAVSLGQCPIS